MVLYFLYNIVFGYHYYLIVSMYHPIINLECVRFFLLSVIEFKHCMKHLVKASYERINLVRILT